MKLSTFTALCLVTTLAAGSAFAQEKPATPPAGAPMGMPAGGTSPMGMPMGGDPSEMMFKMRDTNGDGSISKEEWATPANTSFDAMDANKDGKISKDEMKAPMPGVMMGKPPGAMGAPGAGAPGAPASAPSSKQ